MAPVARARPRSASYIRDRREQAKSIVRPTAVASFSSFVGSLVLLLPELGLLNFFLSLSLSFSQFILFHYVINRAGYLFLPLGLVKYHNSIQ